MDYVEFGACVLLKYKVMISIILEQVARRKVGHQSFKIMYIQYI